MDLHFQPLEPSHVPRILEMMAELYRLDPDFDPSRARRVLEELLANPQWGCAWSIHYDGEIAGYFILTMGYSLEFGGRFVLLDEFLVEEPYRGQGIGTRALQFMADWSRQQGARAIRLEVWHQNPRAFELYRRAGFLVHDRHFMTRPL